ncbi:LOW QUALITY PROTEIN: putative capicua protein [Schistosoma mansoni]|uniref:putative capicua protein n=1 Tax=Schistosoma mansoni TaxID=6183 RepID=UPI00022DC1E3|nr:LOW QUALITY PROTEIN: putative capicua protein [Schistosoma mansoni]|eukprot:XP_018648603.1 LOW QUALITY PROTEIN: putative capicua protein [Schistosoma mansoni]
MDTNSLPSDIRLTGAVVSTNEFTDGGQVIKNINFGDTVVSICSIKTEDESSPFCKDNVCCADTSPKPVQNAPTPSTYYDDDSNNNNGSLCLIQSASRLDLTPHTDQSPSHWRRLKKRTSDILEMQNKNLKTSSTLESQISSVATCNSETSSFFPTVTNTVSTCGISGYNNVEISNSDMESNKNCLYQSFPSSNSSIIPLGNASLLLDPGKFCPPNSKWISPGASGSSPAAALTAVNIQQRFKKGDVVKTPNGVRKKFNGKQWRRLCSREGGIHSHLPVYYPHRHHHCFSLLPFSRPTSPFLSTSKSASITTEMGSSTSATQAVISSTTTSLLTTTTTTVSQQSVFSLPLTSIHFNDRYNSSIIPATVGAQVTSMPIPSSAFTPLLFNASVGQMSPISTPLALLPILTDSISVGEPSLRKQDTPRFNSNNSSDFGNNPTTTESENSNFNKGHSSGNQYCDNSQKSPGHRESDNNKCSIPLLGQVCNLVDIKKSGQSVETDCIENSEGTCKQVSRETSSPVLTPNCSGHVNNHDDDDVVGDFDNNDNQSNVTTPVINLNTSKNDNIQMSNECSINKKLKLSAILNKNNQDRKHVRRPMNAFIIFSMRHRSEVHRLYPNKDNRVASQILGDWWYHLNASEKAPYQQLARELKAAHFQSFPNWKWSSKQRLRSEGGNIKKRCPTHCNSHPETRTSLTDSSNLLVNEFLSVENKLNPCSFTSNQINESDGILTNSALNELSLNNESTIALSQSNLNAENISQHNCYDNHRSIEVKSSDQYRLNGLDLLLHAVQYLDKENNLFNDDLIQPPPLFIEDLDTDAKNVQVNVNKSNTSYTTVTPDQESIPLDNSMKNLLVDSNVNTSTCNSISQSVTEHPSNSGTFENSNNRLQNQSLSDSNKFNSITDLSHSVFTLPQVAVHPNTLLIEVAENPLLCPLSINIKPTLLSTSLSSSSLSSNCSSTELKNSSLLEINQQSIENTYETLKYFNEISLGNNIDTHISNQENSTVPINNSYDQLVSLKEENCVIYNCDNKFQSSTSENSHHQQTVSSKSKPPPLKLQSDVFNYSIINKDIEQSNKSIEKSTPRAPFSADAANRCFKRKFDETTENILAQINFRRRFSYLPKFNPNTVSDTQGLSSPTSVDQLTVRSAGPCFYSETTQTGSVTPTLSIDTSQQLCTLTSPSSHLSDSENIHQNLSPKRLNMDKSNQSLEDNVFFGANFPNIKEVKRTTDSLNSPLRISSSNSTSYGRLSKNHPIAPKIIHHQTNENSSLITLSHLSEANGNKSRSVLHIRRKLVLQLFQEYGLFPSIPVITHFQQCYACYFPSRQALQLKIREIRRRIMQTDSHPFQKTIIKDNYDCLDDKKNADNDEDDNDDEIELTKIKCSLRTISKHSIPIVRSTNGLHEYTNRCCNDNNHNNNNTGTNSSLSSPLAV